MSILNQSTLVLNKNYQPIHVTSVKRAVVRASIGICDILDDEYMRYSWDDWVNLPCDTAECIKLQNGAVRAPFIVIATNYGKIPKCGVKLTRRNIFIRDGGVCQYSGKKLSMSNATLDHVLPESRGGQSSWNNLVLCDKDINAKKANKTPDEAGLKLNKNPEKPKWSPSFRAGMGRIRSSWIPFLSNNGNTILDLEEDDTEEI